MDYHHRFNRDNYSRETISKFDILGSYFVHTFYNVLYKKAKAQWETSKPAESLTFHYKKIIGNYIHVMKVSNGSQSYRKKTMKNLHEYYMDKTGHKSWTYMDFLGTISKEFFPEKFADTLKGPQKQRSFELCVINALVAFEYTIRTKYLTDIIDNHDDTKNTKVLREIFIDNLLMQQHKMYDKIAERSSDQHVPIHIVDKISEERNTTHDNYIKLKNAYEKQTVIYEKKIADLMNACLKIKEYFQEACERISNNDMLIQEQIEQLNTFQENETRLEKLLNEMTAQNTEHVCIINGSDETPVSSKSHIINMSDSNSDKTNSLLVSPNSLLLSPQHHQLDLLDNVLSETLRRSRTKSQISSNTSTLSNIDLTDFNFQDDNQDSNLTPSLNNDTNLF